MAQTGGVLARLSIPGAMEIDNAESFYFMTMDKVKFRKPVVPGDQLRFELQALRTGSRVWKMGGKAFVNEELVAEAELVAVVG
jgi:3-hydroxymyristoyl/3-hydroxydecanoyl-(acyl carrier protein) dehydratase